MTAKCTIQWLGQDGQPTPDANDAIGVAWVLAHDVQVSLSTDGTGPYKRHHIEESHRMPICAEHRAQMVAERLEAHSHWRFEAYPDT